MRYELERLDILGVRFPYDPNHNVRYLALRDAILDCGVSDVLVLGCGRGLVEYVLPEGIRCVSLDLNPEDIEAAREINRYKRNREFHAGDLFRPEEVVGTRKFPLVLISEVIEHVADDLGALVSASRCLAPDGLLVLTVPNTNRFENQVRRVAGRSPMAMAEDHLREYTIDTARNLLRNAGFEILRWRGVWFDFPRSRVAARFLSPYSLWRAIPAAMAPRWATYLMLVCARKAPPS